MARPEIKDFATLLEELLAQAKTRMTRIKNWVVGGVVHSIIAVLAKGLEKLYEALSHAIDLAFLDTTSGIYLVAIARLLGLTPLEATKARGRVVFYRTTTTTEKTVPAGTMTSTSSGSVRFRTTASVTLLVGEAEKEAEVEAEMAGASGNVADDAIVRLVSAVPGIDGVRNDQDGGWLDREGSDAETEDELRVRCQTRWASFAYGGTAELYEFTALSISGVQRVTVRAEAPRGEGSVDVLFTSTAPDGAPTPDLVAEVQALVDARKPCEADVLANGPQMVTNDIAMIIYRDLTGGVANEIEDAVEAAINALFLPTNNPLAFDIGDDLVQARLFAAAIAVPHVANVVLTAPAFDDEGKVDIPDDGLARLGSLTVEVV